MTTAVIHERRTNAAAEPAAVGINHDVETLSAALRELHEELEALRQALAPVRRERSERHEGGKPEENGCGSPLGQRVRQCSAMAQFAREIVGYLLGDLDL